MCCCKYFDIKIYLSYTRDISLGIDNTWVMWMKDPDGNPFEIMEYTDKSYQVIGR